MIIFVKIIFKMNFSTSKWILFSFLIFGACKNSDSVKVISVSDSDKVKIEEKNIAEKAIAKMSIEGMTCTIGCAATIQKKLNSTSGVVSATVDFKSKTAWIVYDAQALNLEGITQVVKASGDVYSVSSIDRTDTFKE